MAVGFSTLLQQLAFKASWAVPVFVKQTRRAVFDACIDDVGVWHHSFPASDSANGLV
jgi:hypothetical protein